MASSKLERPAAGAVQARRPNRLALPLLLAAGLALALLHYIGHLDAVSCGCMPAPLQMNLPCRQQEGLPGRQSCRCPVPAAPSALASGGNKVRASPCVEAAPAGPHGGRAGAQRGGDQAAGGPPGTPGHQVLPAAAANGAHTPLVDSLIAACWRKRLRRPCRRRPRACVSHLATTARSPDLSSHAHSACHCLCVQNTQE